MNKEYESFLCLMMGKRGERSCSMSLKAEVSNYMDRMLQFLFPQYSSQQYFEADEITSQLVLLKRDLKTILHFLARDRDVDVDRVADGFIDSLPGVTEMLWEDAEAIDQGDPASECTDEVILAYPGFLAISVYRLAHELYMLHVPIVPRIMTEYAHGRTGIDIHPGASIGRRFVIDHGTGIVIGETSNIGDDVKLYQGVTLGALSVQKNLAKKKRHPTIRDRVVIYSQAVILGGETVIGHDSVIGGNVWLTDSVPPYSMVYHKKEDFILRNKQVEDDSQGFNYGAGI